MFIHLDPLQEETIGWFLFYSKGIEDVAVENSLEENIAVVSFGNETRVVQNLTNDYSKIRDAVGKGTPQWGFVMPSKLCV